MSKRERTQGVAVCWGLIRPMIIWGAVLLGIGLSCLPCYGAELDGNANDGPKRGVYENEFETEYENGMAEYDFSNIQEFLDRQGIGAGEGISFEGLMKDLVAGNGTEAVKRLLPALKEYLFGQVAYNSQMLWHVMVLGILGAVFTNFSSIFTSSQISETGFFVTYLLIFTFLASGFYESINLTAQVTEQILEFIRALVPSYFLAVAWAGAAVSSAAWCPMVLFLVSLVQVVFAKMLLPLVKVYVLLTLAGHIAKENMLSKLTELLSQVIRWSMKTLIGMVLGFHMLQGLVLPYVDSMKTAGVRKFVQIIPGVGQGVEAAAQVMLGSGVLIKNTMGVAAVLILTVITVIPLLKLLILLFLYQAVAAALQPVCDKRMISCISSIAEGQKMLLGIVLSTALLFIITIALICASTNTAYLV